MLKPPSQKPVLNESSAHKTPNTDIEAAPSTGSESPGSSVTAEAPIQTSQSTTQRRSRWLRWLDVRGKTAQKADVHAEAHMSETQSSESQSSEVKTLATSSLQSQADESRSKAVALGSATNSTGATPGTKPKTDVTAQADKEAPKKRVKRFPTIPTGKAAACLGILAAGSGLAFTQVAPTDIQAAVLPEKFVPEVPLRRSGDPAVEPFGIQTRNLFLTNQIFYRKVEALARLSGGVIDPSAKPSAKPLGTTGKKSGANAGATPAGSSGAKASSAGAKPSSGTTGAAATGTAAAAKDKDDQVVAAAPPAPKVEPAPLFTGTTIDSVLEMRVAVAKDVGAISFATSSGGLLTDLDGNVLKSLPAETAAYAEEGNGVVVDGETLPSAFWVYPEDGGYVAIGSSWYRGRVLIAQRERGLIAVNYVLLGDYLYSVVGTEMSPDWAIESLKAQAVAARSYALTHNIHPASEQYFDLDNTQRFQAYKGIGREADTTQAAVQATAGEFISHDGGIVESLYAASQAIVDDAHKGSGMSQLGAKDLAEQGYSYTEILGHYYPGTGLGRIETDPE